MAVVCTVLLLCACGQQDGSSIQGVQVAEPEADTPVVVPRIAVPLLDCLYHDEGTFYQGVAAPASYTLEEGYPLAGVVPHHLLATDMIAGFFSMAGQHQERYDRVILVSPAHFPETCGSDVVTGLAHWRTPFGVVKGDKAAVEVLLQNPVVAAENNPAALELDHGGAGLIPYIRYYLPDIPVAVCLLSNRLEQHRLEEVHRVLRELCADGRTLLVVSVDCSHYLTPREAEARDMETAQAIAERDYQAIYQFTDDNVDSPQALSSLLVVAEELELELVMLGHSSSAELLPHTMDNPVYGEGITTYMVYAGTRNDAA